MNITPYTSLLGHLEVEEVFEFYDIPRLFSARNRSGQYFLALSVEEDADEHKFLYVPVSAQRLSYIRTGGLDLRQAFNQPEDGTVVLVKIPARGDATATTKFASELPEDWLPMADEFLALEGSEEFSRTVVDVYRVSSSTRREAVNILVHSRDSRRTEIPTRRLSSILSTFQELVDALGQRCEGEPTLRGAIPAGITDRTRMNVAHTFPGSFGVHMRADQNSDLLNDSLLGGSLQELAHLLDARDDEERLSNKLHYLKGRAASKYRSFLESVASSDHGLRLLWGSPKDGRGGHFDLTREEIASALRVVSAIDLQMAEEVIIPCVLVGLNVRTKTYELSSLDDEQKFSGRISDEAPKEVSHATLSQQYKAFLRRMIEVQASGEEKEKWILTDLQPL